MNQTIRVYPLQLDMKLNWTFHLEERYKERLLSAYGNIESFFQLAGFNIMQAYLSERIDIGEKFVIVPKTITENFEQPVFICVLSDIDYDYISLTIVTCFINDYDKFNYIMPDGEVRRRKFMKSQNGEREQIIYVNPKNTSLQNDGVNSNGLASILRYNIVCNNSDNFLDAEMALFRTTGRRIGSSSVNFIHKDFEEILKYLFDMIYNRTEFNERNSTFYIVDGPNAIVVRFDGFEVGHMVFKFTALYLCRYDERSVEILTKSGMKGFGSTTMRPAAWKMRQAQVASIASNSGLALDRSGHVDMSESRLNRLIKSVLNEMLIRIK